jgi:AP-2 complex subunit mu-1
MEFISRYVATKEHKENPFVYIDGTSYMHIQQKDIIIMAATKTNVNAAMTFQYLYNLVQVCIAYFEDFNENTIRKNFTLIYELLDEMMDYGIPQIMETEVLKQYIFEGGLKQESLSDINKLKQITIQATGDTSWRKPNVWHKKNEVFIDVIENVNVTLSERNTILRADVAGKISCKCKLSGMPECKLGMNDKLLMQRDPKKYVLLFYF